MKRMDKKWNFDLKIIGIGTVAALIISIVLIGTEAWMVLNGNISYSASKYISVLIYFVSLSLAGVILKVLQKTADWLSMLAMCIVYFIFVLVMNLLVYSGGIHNFGYALLGVGCGMGVCILQNRQPKRVKSHRKKVRIR